MLLEGFHVHGSQAVPFQDVCLTACGGVAAQLSIVTLEKAAVASHALPPCRLAKKGLVGHSFESFWLPCLTLLQHKSSWSGLRIYL